MNLQVRVDQLLKDIHGRVPLDAATLLVTEPEDVVVALLQRIPPRRASDIAAQLRDKVVWKVPGAKIYDTPKSLRDLLVSAAGVMSPDQTVADAIAFISTTDDVRDVVYLFVTDADQTLLGLVVIRDLLRAKPEQPLRSVMLRDPFHLSVDSSLTDAIKAAAKRHYPVYPVCDAQGHLLGQVMGYRLFECHVIEITAQSGQMVGVAKEEHVATTVWTAFCLRHPWLQLNLLTAFVAAFVVGSFEDTIARVVALAAFLPVLAGQAGNTGCQAQAITLRSLTLGQLKDYPVSRLLRKEALLGLMNGVLTGAVAGLAMWIFADEHAGLLAMVIMLAMVGSCVASGVAGVLVPLGLKRMGADPATASTIFLTTATDIVGMGLMLFLATTFVL